MVSAMLPREAVHAVAPSPKSGAPASAESPASEREGARGDVRFRSQFRKTELCAFHMQGWCSKADRCEFAHGEQELQRPPDLTKTSLCKKWLRHACELPSHECPFAHGARELRVTEVYAGNSASPTARSRKAAKQKSNHEARVSPTSSGSTEVVLPQPQLEYQVATTPTSTCVAEVELLATAPMQQVCMPAGERVCPCPCPAEYVVPAFPVPVPVAAPYPCAALVASVAAQAAAQTNLDLELLLRQAMPETYED